MYFEQKSVSGMSIVVWYVHCLVSGVLSLGMGKSVPFSSLYCHDSGLGKERNTVDATTGEF